MATFKKYYIYILVFVFFVWFSVYSITRHLRLESYLFDLGYYDQVLWLMSHLKPLYSSLQETHVFKGHFNPSLYLLAPFYKLIPGAITLLVIQAAALSAAAIPVYLLSLKKTKNIVFSLLTSFSFLMFFGIHQAIGYEFHPLSLGVFLLSWIFYFYETKKLTLFWVALIIFMGMQENLIVIAGGIGLYLILQYKDYKRGFIILLTSIVSFIFIVFVLVPSIDSTPYLFLPQAFSMSETIQKLTLVGLIFTSFGFLPLLNPLTLLIIFSDLGLRLSIAPTANYWQLGYHYNSILAPMLALGLIGLYPKLRKKIFLTRTLLLVGIVASWIAVKPDTLKVFNRNFFDFNKYQSAQEIFRQIPKAASLKATNNLGPHLTQRSQITFLTNCKDNPTQWVGLMKRCFKLVPDYIVADLDPKVGNNIWPEESLDSIKSYLKELEDSGEYIRVDQRNNIILLLRN